MLKGSHRCRSIRVGCDYLEWPPNLGFNVTVYLQVEYQLNGTMFGDLDW